MKQAANRTKLKQGKSLGAIAALYQVAEKLGIIKALGNKNISKLVLWMIMARVLDRNSKLTSIRTARNHYVFEVLNIQKSFNENDLYHSMDWLARNQEKIELKLYQQLKKENKLDSIYLYDAASSYLEGTHNEMAAYGYNRDGKKHKMRIVIGLLTDKNGVPLAVRVFRGNTNDTKTVEEQLKILAKRFGIKKVVFAGDRGMIKRAQIEDIQALEYNFITAITKEQTKTLLAEKVITMELFDKNLCEVF